MCDELAKAIEIQSEYDVDTTKGATLLAKAALKSMRAMNENFIKHCEESDKKWGQLAQDIKELKASFEEYKTDATKYRLIVELVKALFGTPKKSILTLCWFAVLIGVAHLKDIIELLKVLV
jgi:hypothetical protein